MASSIPGPSDSSRLPLIPRDSGGDLSQQGSVNWDNIVHRTVTFSVGVLNRCANAGVDPYTVVVGQAIAQNLPLARRGRQNIHDAVTSLQFQNSISDAMWFGFGIRAFVRTLVLTNEGTSLLALCATLAECFHEDVAAEVMFHIVKAFQAPRELAPSTTEWLMIVRACSGALATTKFPILAEGFMRLDPSSARTTMPRFAFHQSSFARGFPLPGDLAAVLVALGKVASGQLDSIHVSGCAAVGWVGAVAEWLFDLRVIIFPSPEDSVDPVYSNCPSNQDAQVYLTMERPEGELSSAPPVSTSSSQPRVHLVSKSYLLPDSTALVALEAVSLSYLAIGKVLLSGRVPWQSCLTNTFGLEFERLCKTPLNFGKALGCAARIFKAITKAEPEVPWLYLKGCQSYFDASYGQGFIQNAIRWFPELATVRPAMETASRLSFNNAKAGYEESFAAIQRLCNCSVCSDWENMLEEQGFCLVIVMETIIVLCQVTAGLTVADHLHPTRCGLESFYKRQLNVHNWIEEPESTERDEDGGLREGLQAIGPLIYVLWANDFVTLTLEDYSTGMEARLVAAIKLFTGRSTLKNGAGSAVSAGGICAYLDILREVSVAPENAGRVNVIPGSIEHDHKCFPKVQDDEINLLRRQIRRDGSVPAPLPRLCAAIAELSEVVLEATETSYALAVNFLFRGGGGGGHQDGAFTPFLRVGPSHIIKMAHKARGLVQCPSLGQGSGQSGAAATTAVPGSSICQRKGKRSSAAEAPWTSSADAAEYPILKVKMPGSDINGSSDVVVEVCDTAKGGEILRIVALGITTTPGVSSLYSCILSDGECVNCCIRKALLLDSESSERGAALVIADITNQR